MLLGEAIAAPAGDRNSAAAETSARATDLDELAGTLRMIGAHAPLRQAEAADADAQPNRAALETMIRKTVGSSPRPVPTSDRDGKPPPGLVGSLEGAFSVDNRGKANYDITLPLPDSRGYFQPSLSIQYDSGVGEGEMGRGFYVSMGFYRAIVRGRSLLARDGEVRSKELGERDRYYLDGKRLVCISGPGTQGKPGSVYRTEVDSFITIRAEGDGDQVERFTLVDRNGRTLVFGKFGRSDDGFQRGFDELRQTLDPIAHTYALKRVEDRLGDTVEFNYGHAGLGEWLLEDIAYAGGQGIAPPFRIRFVYSPKGAPVSKYSVLRRVDETHRLDAIEVIATGAAVPVVRYGFDYAPGPGHALQRLRSITGAFAAEVGQPLQPLPPTTFEWNESAPAGSPFIRFPADVEAGASGGPGCVAVGDFDGDGKTDYVDGRDGLRVRLSTAEGPGRAAVPWLEERVIARVTPPGSRQIFPADFNGDGRTDLLIVSADARALPVVSTGSGFRSWGAVDLKPCLRDYGAEGASGPPTFALLQGEGQAVAARLSLADYSGDGRDDLLVHGYDGALHVYFSNGTALVTVAEAARARDAAPPLPPGGSRVQAYPRDLNDDGLVDYAWLETGPPVRAGREAGAPGGGPSLRRTLKYAIFLPEGRFSEPVTLFEDSEETWARTEAAADLIRRGTVLQGDFNGDDLTDFLVWSPGTKATAAGWMMFLGRGYPTSLPRSAGDAFRRIDSVLPMPWPMPDGVIPLVADFNGDGLDDLAWRQARPQESDAAGHGDPRTIWWLSCAQGGDAFSPARPLEGEPWASFSAIAGGAAGKNEFEVLERSYDFNGDGALDWTLLRGADASGERALAYAPGDRAPDGVAHIGDLVTRFTNGYGSSVRVAYKAAKDDTVYTAGAPVGYPILEWRSSTRVVSDIWKDAGGDVAAQYSYQYSGNHLDFSGRGGMGFAAFTTLDRQTGFIKYQFLTHSFPMTGLTSREETFWCWNVGEKIALKQVAKEDHAVTFDAVTDPATGQLFGTVHPFTSQSIESRWSTDTKPDYLFTLAAPKPGLPSASFLSAKDPAPPLTQSITRNWKDRQAATEPPPLLCPDVGLAYDPGVGTPLVHPAPPPAADLFRAAGRFPARITYGNVGVTESGDDARNLQRTVKTYQAPLSPADPFVSLVETSTGFRGHGDDWQPDGTGSSYAYFPGTPWLERETTSTRSEDEAASRRVTTARYQRDHRGRTLHREDWLEDFAKEDPEAVMTSFYTASDFDEAADRPMTEATDQWTRNTLRYHPLFRKLTAASYDNGVHARFGYDGLGRSILTVNDAKYRAETVYAWTARESEGWQRRQEVVPPAGCGGLANHSVYAIQESETGEPTTTTYYDRISRKIRAAATDKSGLVLIVDNIYDAAGQLVATSDPYARVDETRHWTIKAYDGYGRVSSEKKAEFSSAAEPPAAAVEYLRRGAARERKSDRTGALADYESAAKADPREPQAFFACGRLRTAAGDREGAFRDFSRAVELDPNFAAALAFRGACLRDKGEYAPALADLSRSLELAPDEAWTWDSRGEVKLELQQIDDAIADYSQAIKLQADEEQFWYDRGRARLRGQDFTGAIEDLTEAIRLDPKRDLAFYRRAQARFKQGDHAGAMADYSAAIKLEPKDYTNFSARGMVRDLTGDFRGALADYEQAIAVADEDVSYLRFRCFLLRRRLEFSGADQHLNAVVTKSGNEWVKTLARLLQGASDETAVLAAANSAAEPTRQEHRCEAFYYAGMLRLVKGDRSGAQELFEKCVGTNLTAFYEHGLAAAELRRLAMPPRRAEARPKT